MRKITSALALLLLVFGFQSVQAEGVQFEHGTWDQALKKASKENKIIFLDAYTTWCGPCKWMSANVMTLPEVGEFFNENFVNVKMDMEKGEGITLAKNYKVGAYPTLAFIDGNGDMVWRVAGALGAEEFVALGKKILAGVEPVQKMYDKYDSGNYDKEFLYDYLIHTSEVAMQSGDALDKYAKMMKPSDLANDQDFDVFVRFFNKTDSEFFVEFESNLDKYRELHGAEKVNEKYYGTFLKAMQRAAYNNEQKDFKMAQAKIGTNGGEDIQANVNNMVVYNIMQNQTKEAAYSTISQFVEKGMPFPAQGLNYYAWGVYEEVDEPDVIEQAVRWAAVATEKTNDPMIMDTWGMLLYKKGDVDEAIEKLEEAIAVAKETGVPMDETEKELARIKGER